MRRTPRLRLRTGAARVTPPLSPAGCADASVSGAATGVPPVGVPADPSQTPDLVVVVDDEPAATDEALLTAARAGDEAALTALLTRYRGLARARAGAYFIVGADRDDLAQEAMIGLYKAVRDYTPGLGASFRTFADVCVTRQVITAVKAATRHKHGPLNDYVSLSRSVSTEGDEDRTLADVLARESGSDPAELIVAAERIEELQRHVDSTLSDLEVEVLRLYLQGRSYTEIAGELERQVKSVDNALQRVKRKIDEHLRERAVAERG